MSVPLSLPDARRVLVDRGQRRAGPGAAAQPRVRGLRGARRGSAARGLAALADAPADLVLLDLMLPDGDGFHVLRTLRAAGDATPCWC